MVNGTWFMKRMETMPTPFFATSSIYHLPFFANHSRSRPPYADRRSAGMVAQDFLNHNSTPLECRNIQVLAFHHRGFHIFEPALADFIKQPHLYDFAPGDGLRSRLLDRHRTDQTAARLIVALGSAEIRPFLFHNQEDNK